MPNSFPKFIGEPAAGEVTELILRLVNTGIHSMTENSIPRKNANSEPKRKSATRLSGEDFLVFVISFLQCYRFNLVGVVSGADMALLLAFIVYLLRKRIFIPRGPARKFYIFASLWLISQIATDLIRHSPFRDYARGWSMIGLVMINFAIMCTLFYRRPRRILIYGWGIVAAGVITMLFEFDAGEFNPPDRWKMGWAYFVTLAIFLYVSRKECRRSVQLALMFGIGLLNIFLLARSMGAICLGAGLYVAMTPALRKREARGAHMSLGTKFALIAGTIVGGSIIYFGYSYVAAQGMLGDAAREKFQEQNSGKYGFLLGGRVQLLSTIPAIIDSPIIGHGSWARDVKYEVIMRQALIVLDYKGALEMSRDELVEGLIPTHSILLQAWVWAGFLGALFWAWVGILIVRSLTFIYPVAANLIPLLALVSLLTLWDILFSPFGLDRRQLVPYYFVLIVTYHDVALLSAKKTPKKHNQRILNPAFSHGD